MFEPNAVAAQCATAITCTEQNAGSHSLCSLHHKNTHNVRGETQAENPATSIDCNCICLCVGRSKCTGRFTEEIDVKV